MKIYIDGKDNLGWAIDSIRKNIKNSLIRSNIEEVNNLFKADIIHNIWWNKLLTINGIRLSFFLANFRFTKIFLKNILVTATNFIDPEEPNFQYFKEFNQMKRIAKAWIVPGTKQKMILEKMGLLCFFHPLDIDLKLFRPLGEANIRNEILCKYHIPAEKLQNRVVIGSFQRDSLGSDLTKPKWQKNPEFLVELLKDLPKDKFVLLLTAPRRHYVINKCKEYNIPYWYVGVETEEDNINDLSIKIEDMPNLYSLIDIYLVTSSSEGGPTTLLEALATKTLTLSTDVGCASDFLEPENIFSDKEKYKKALFNFIMAKDRKNQYRSYVEKGYEKCISLLNDQVVDRRLLSIYKEILD